jgi:1-acyl-sn-glycerol-3-phosphate acyltransferase
MKKKENWAKFRHRVVWFLLRPVGALISVLKFNVRIEKYRDNRPCLWLMNHQTPFDQFFVAVSSRRPVYFIATEDIMSNGWISRVLHWLVAPIPIKKQAGDFSAVITVLRVAREGVSIAMAPEGNRTYSGKTEYMNPAVAGLAKKMRMPIVLYRIEGGYGKEPRWSNVTRSGKMRAYVSRVIEPEEYAQLSNDELYELIKTGLYVDEGVADGVFNSPKRAEHLERAVYVCPFCGLSKFESRGNEAWCTTCNRRITYGVDKTISGVGFDFPFRFMTQWYDYQQDFVNQLDLMQYTTEPVFRDQAKLSLVVLNKRKQVLRKWADMALYGDRVVIDEGREDQLVIPFAEATAVAVLGRNKLNIYHGANVYQFKGDKSFNALKYVNFYYRHKNIIRGDENGKFLGL